MPRFEELSDTDLDALRQYLRAQSAAARAQAAKSLAER
jgi:hypothetical protein